MVNLSKHLVHDLAVELNQIANFLEEWHLPEYDEKDAKKLARKIRKIRKSLWTE